MMTLPNPLDGKRKILLVRLVINGFVQAAMTVAHAKLVEQIFNRLIYQEGNHSNQAILFLGAGLILTILGRTGLLILQRTDTERIGQSYARDIRIALYDCLSRLSPRGIQRRSQGGVMLRFVGDITALRQWASLGLSRLAVTTAMITGVLIALIRMNMLLALNIGVVLIIGLFSTLKIGQKFRQKAKESRKRMSKLAANINEKIACMAVVQVFGQSRRERERIVRQSHALEDIRIERAYLAGQLRGSSEATGALCVAILLVVGAIEVSMGRTTPSSIVAAMSIIGFLTSPLRDLSRVQEYWHDSRVALQKLEEFLENPAVIEDRPTATPLKFAAGRLSFESVSLDGILENISAIAEPGEIVAIVGPNGAGKSTLMNMAARLLEPDAGTVKLDGQDLSAHTLESIREKIAMVGPDLPLLRGSLRKNLLYRDPNASQGEIDRVWEQCEIHRLIHELPNGEDTKISEQGPGLFHSKERLE